MTRRSKVRLRRAMNRVARNYALCYSGFLADGNRKSMREWPPQDVLRMDRLWRLGRPLRHEDRR